VTPGKGAEAAGFMALSLYLVAVTRYTSPFRLNGCACAYALALGTGAWPLHLTAIFYIFFITLIFRKLFMGTMRV
jgi:hypothetical protein